jgi:hypothetical protein
MSNDMSVVLLQRLLELEACKDSIEFGKADGRIKVYVNSRDPAGAIEQIQTMIDMRAYAEVASPRPVSPPAKEAPQ